MSSYSSLIITICILLLCFPKAVFASEKSWKINPKNNSLEFEYEGYVLLSGLEFYKNQQLLLPKIEEESAEPMFNKVIIGLYDKDALRQSELTVLLAETELDSLARIDLEADVVIEGLVNFGKGPIACRLSSPRDEKVYQVATGRGISPKADSLYDASLDLALEMNGCKLFNVEKGYKIRVENQEMVRFWLRKNVIKRLGIEYYSPLNRESFQAAPTGWCSWYSYYQKITANEWKKNVLWLKDNLRDYGCEWVQLDDGWQAFDGNPNTEGGRDWFNTNNKFKNGMKEIASIVKESGMKPGIWLIPQKIDRDDIYARNPAYFLHYNDGRPVKHTDWAPENRAMYVVDVTNQEALDNYYKPLIDMIVNDWGFEYLKIDDQPRIANLYKEYNIVFHDPNKKGTQAYRISLEEIKKILGPSGYLLGCYGIPLDGVGIMDGSRTGGDMGASWDGSQIIIDAVFRWGFLNGLGWWCDPDTVCVRSPLTLDEARMLASMVTLTGQAFMASDFMYRLPADRIDILRRSMPTLPTTPVELYPWDNSQRTRPKIILNSINKDWGSYYIAAIYQWSEESEECRSAFPQNKQSIKIIGILEGQFLTDADTEMILADDDKRDIYNEKIKAAYKEGPKEAAGFNLDLTGVKKIELVATDGMDNNLADWSQWADVKITKADGTTYYLSNKPDGVKIKSYEVSWGVKGYNTNPEGRPINIAGQVYRYGFGAHAPSRIEIELTDEFVKLEGVAGLEKGYDGSVSMHVLLDGVPQFNTYLSKSVKIRPLKTGLKEPELLTEVAFADLGLSEGPYHVFDYWENKYLGILKEKISLSPRPFSVNILSIVPALDRPQLISTNRHISQGAVEISELKWDKTNLTLSGTSQLVALDPYEMRIALPDNYQLIDVSAKDLDVKIIKEKSLVRIQFISPITSPITWQMHFREN